MLEGKMKYAIRYSITTSLLGHGEFSGEQKVAVYKMDSVSNDLNEIFTDLFDQHRNESIVGIEILGVMMMDELAHQLRHAV